MTDTTLASPTATVDDDGASTDPAPVLKRRVSTALGAVCVGAASLIACGVWGLFGRSAANLAVATAGLAVLLACIAFFVVRRLRRPGRKPFWRRGPVARWPWYGFDPAPMTGVTETATWFGSEKHPLFGWLSMPESRAAALGVVLCPPVGEEARSTHRTYRRLGSELARRGMVALRVDYDGSGDSSGGQHDSERVAAWQRSILDAAGTLRAMGLQDVAAVGMRLGATLTAGVAANAGLSSVVLWDPCTSGRTFLREGTTLQRIAGYPVVDSDNALIETPGFAYDSTTAADLRDVSLSKLPAEPWCKRLLVLTRTGRPIAGAAAVGLKGPHVEWARAIGQDRLVDVEPNEARTPIRVVEHVADWLAAGIDEPAMPFVATVRTEVLLTDPGSGALIRERITELGPNQLFGIISEPLEHTAKTPWIGLVNVAIEPHIGPGRRWVDYARNWASLGFRCVRFDQSGLGDSPVKPGQAEDKLFDPLWLEDIPDIFGQLAPDAPVGLFGLCSGSYSAFEAATRAKVDALYCVSAGFGSPWLARGQPVYSNRRMPSAAFIKPLGDMFHRNTRVAFGLWRLYCQIAPWNAPMAVVHRVLKRGTTIRLLLNTYDSKSFREVLWWSLVRRRSVTKTRRFSMKIDPMLEHALMTQYSQDTARDDATQFWLSHFGERFVPTQG